MADIIQKILAALKLDGNNFSQFSILGIAAALIILVIFLAISLVAMLENVLIIPS